MRGRIFALALCVAVVASAQPPAVEVHGCAEARAVLEDVLEHTPCTACPPARVIDTMRQLPTWRVIGTARRGRINELAAWFRGAYTHEFCPAIPSTGRLTMEVR